jgi:hypothetical protein
MANVANNSIAATYGGAQLNEILYEPVFRSDDIMSNYRVIPNVKHKMNVYTSAALTKIVDAYTTCSSSSGSVQFDVDDKVITAGRCRVALEQCTDEFFGTYIEEMYRSGVDVMNIEGTQLADAIVNRAVRGIQSDVVRLAWGGDISGAVSGYTAFDGWMDLMAADATVLAARDTLASVAAIPTAAETMTGLVTVYNGAPAALQQVPASEKKMFVTPQVYNRYLEELENNGANLGLVNLQDGVPKAHFRGVEVVPMYEWDTIVSDTDPIIFTIGINGRTNGICYCAKDNLIIGSDTTDPSSEFKVFYDDLEEKMFLRAYFKLGVQFLYPSLVQWGIFDG